MARVSLAIGNLSLELEDEDAGARKLLRLGHKEFMGLIEHLESGPAEEEEDVDG